MRLHSGEGLHEDFICTADGMEIEIIFNFLDLLVHENRVANLAPKKKAIFTQKNRFSTLESLINLDSISWNNKSPDCVTLVVED